MAKFEVGMEVLIHPRRPRARLAVGTVASVGKAVVLTDGREYTLGGHGYNEDRIEPLTPEVRARVARAIEAQRLDALRAEVVRAVLQMDAADLDLVGDLIVELRAAQSAPR